MSRNRPCPDVDGCSKFVSVKMSDEIKNLILKIFFNPVLLKIYFDPIFLGFGSAAVLVASFGCAQKAAVSFGESMEVQAVVSINQ